MWTRRIIYTLMVVFAFLLGYTLAAKRVFPRDIRTLMQGVGDNERTATVLSLAALQKLELGDIEGAKRLLAREAAAYYHTFYKIAGQSERQQNIREHVEAVSQRSPILKQMLEERRQ